MMRGDQLRDQGIGQVMLNAADWSLISDVAFRFWLTHVAPKEFTIEDFRLYAEKNDMPQPHHPNAWGGLTKRFAHLIEQVGYTQSRRPSAHSRLTRTYKKV